MALTQLAWHNQERTMKRLITFATAALFVFVAACSDSEKGTGPDEVTVSDLVGSWTASSLVYTDNANPAQSLDLVALGGENRVTVLAGGGARTWVEFGTFSDEWDAQLSISGNVLTSNPVEASRGVRTWEFTLNGDVLELTDTDATFDFTLSGAAGVSVTEKVIFLRQ